MKKVIALCLVFLMMVGLLPAGLASSLGENDLLLWYDFSETEGSVVADKSGNGNHGTRHNDTEWKNGALYFGGTSGYVSMPDGILYGHDTITIAINLKPEVERLNYFTYNFGNSSSTGYLFLNTSRPNGHLRYGITKTTYSSEEEIANSNGVARDTWTNIVIVLDKSSGTGYMYRDGVLVGTNTNLTTWPSDLGATTQNWIGRSPYPDPYLKGMVDDFRIYNRALSASEVAELDLEYKTNIAELILNSVDFAYDGKSIVDSINLPSNNSPEIATMKWESSEPDYITNEGELLKRPDDGQENKEVTFTLTITVGAATVTKDFKITILSLSPENDLSIYAKQLLVPKYLTNDLPTSIGEAEVKWESDPAGFVNEQGIVSRPLGENQKINLKATLSYQNAIYETSYNDVEVLGSGGSVLTYVSKGDGGYITPADTRRSDALYIAAKETDAQSYTILNKGKPILYVKWRESVASAPNAQMGSPSLFRKEDGTYGLVASANNKGPGIYLWDSDDLITFKNERYVRINSDNSAVEDPKIIFDIASNSYKLFWKSSNGIESFVSTSKDGLNSFTEKSPAEYIDYGIKGILPDNAVANETSEFELTALEYERIIRKYDTVRNIGIENIKNINIQVGEELPDLVDRVELKYSDGSKKKLGVKWNQDDINAIDTSVPGSYSVRGTVVQSIFDYPYIPERADPFIFYNEDDGYYYATGSYYPESDPATWTESEMAKVDYDRVTLRRAKTLEELRTAEEYDAWVPRGEDGFTPFLWAPEVHKIQGKWYILVGAREATSGRSWCSTMVLVEYTGSLEEMQSGGMLKKENWKPKKIQNSPCSFDMTYAEVDGVGYYIWPRNAELYIQKVDPSDPTRLIGQPVKIKGIEWPFEYGKHNVDNTDQGIVEGAAVLQYGDKIYLSYAGATVDKYYCTAVLVADAGSDIMDPNSWTHPTYPALSTEDVLNVEGINPHVGPGHNSFALDEYGNPINVYHARPYPDPHVGPGAGGLHDPCRHTMVKTAHVAYDGTLILNMTAEEELDPKYKDMVIKVNVGDAASIPQDGLIADYSFVEAPQDGKTVENKATGEGAVGNAIVQNESTAKWEDNALVFSGEGTSVNNPVGTWVSLPNDILSGKTSATISIEAKPSTSIISKHHFLWSIGNTGTNTYWFMNTRDPRTSIKYGGSEKTAQSSTKLTGNRWYSLTAVVDAEAKTISFYIDGIKVGEARDNGMSLAQILDQSRNTIGRAPYNDPMFQGSVSTFRVYDRALSAEEIKAISDADAKIHEDVFQDYVQAAIEGVSDIIMTDSTMRLPDYGGTVTWKSNTPGVTILEDGVTVFAVQPAAGEEALIGTLTATMTIRGATESKDVNITVEAAPAPTDPYGYLMVHFIEDSAGYKEKIYLDISRGDNPEQWDPLNGGEPILASNLSTTGVRDPFLTYNPETETYYIIATDLRVFGGDNLGWSGWSRRYSTKMNVWESKDLITWSEQRQFDVSLDKDGNKVAVLGMMWAPEATWVPDYYDDGRGAFIVYWSSRHFSMDDPNQESPSAYEKVMWGVTTDFTQDTYEFGGVFVDIGGDCIDTNVIQHNGKTYRISKDNSKGNLIFMQSTDAKEWWKPEAVWTTIQTRIGSSYGSVEGPATFKNHNEDKWYLYVDVIPSIGYRPMVTTNLDDGWQYLNSPDFYMAPSTKHGGIISLTKAQYDAIREADAISAVSENLGTIELAQGISEEELKEALPKTAEVNLAYNRGTSNLPVTWDISQVDLSTAGTYSITGTVRSIGANLNQWVGKDGSTSYLAEDKQLYSSTAITVTAVVNVYEEQPEEKFAIETVFNLEELAPNKSLNAQVVVRNDTSKTDPVLAIVALYDGDKMINVSYISEVIPVGQTEKLNAGFKLPSDINNHKVRVFVWDGTNLKDTNMQPLSNVVELQ